jgi:hypothetical protein
MNSERTSTNTKVKQRHYKRRGIGNKEDNMRYKRVVDLENLRKKNQMEILPLVKQKTQWKATPAE